MYPNYVYRPQRVKGKKAAADGKGMPGTDFALGFRRRVSDASLARVQAVIVGHAPDLWVNGSAPMFNSQ